MKKMYGHSGEYGNKPKMPSDAKSLLQQGVSEEMALGQSMPREAGEKGQRPKPISGSVSSDRGTFPVK